MTAFVLSSDDAGKLLSSQAAGTSGFPHAGSGAGML